MSTPTTIRVWESHLAVYKRIWHGHVLLALVQPTLYLLGIGLGVGALVDDNVDSASALGGLTYFEFLAPALLTWVADRGCGRPWGLAGGQAGQPGGARVRRAGAARDGPLPGGACMDWGIKDTRPLL